MGVQKFKFKSDKYRKARGGYSRFLNIYCSKCHKHIFLYQKDGPGPLKRAYKDRILAPEEIKETKNISCPNCKSKIGTFYIYEKENREAYLLDPLSFIKKITKGIYPPEEIKK